MTGRADLPEQIDKLLTHTLQKQDSEAQVWVRRTSLGWLHLHVITSSFAGQTTTEREMHIDEILAALSLNLGGYPFADYTLQTAREALKQAPFLPILPLWSEILMAPEPDEPVPLDEDTNATRRPFIVTFYSLTQIRPRIHGRNAHLTHIPADSFSVDTHPFALELRSDLSRSIKR
jgi:hypothetical protein